MKKFLSLILIASMLTACTSKTEHGDCVGIAEDKNPALKYEISWWNVGMSILFFELIAPPIIVLVDALSCPVGPADDKS